MHLLSRVLVQKDARLLRDLRIMAYFRQCFPSDMNITAIKELARALAAHPPYELPISAVKIKHLHCEVSSARYQELHDYYVAPTLNFLLLSGYKGFH